MLKIIIKNTTSNIALFVAKMAITFIMTPVIIQNLGNYDYGIWEIVMVVIGYMGMLDFGVRPTAARFAALYNAKKDIYSLNRIYSTSIYFLFLISVFIFIVMIIWAIYYPETLSQKQEDNSRYTLLLIIIAVQLIFEFPGQIAESFLEGLQKYHLKNVVTLINSIIGSFLVYTFITPQNGLILLAMLNAAGSSIKYLIYIYLLTRKENNSLVFSRKYIGKETLHEILIFGFKTFIQGAASRLSSGADKIIIAGLLGPAVIVFYALSASLTSYISNTRMLLTHAFMPLFSHLHATDQGDDIRKWFLVGTRIVTGIIFALSIGILLLGKEFIGIWIGQEYAEKGKYVLYIMCTFHLFNSLNPFSNRYLTAVNKHGFLAVVNIVTAFLNILLSIIFSYYLGIAGIALGALIPSLIAIPLILKYTCSSIDIPIRHYFTDSILPLFIPILALTLTILLLKHYFVLDNYMNLIVVAITGSIIYLIIFFVTTLTIDEKRVVITKAGEIFS